MGKVPLAQEIIEMLFDLQAPLLLAINGTLQVSVKSGVDTASYGAELGTRTAQALVFLLIVVAISFFVIPALLERRWGRAPRRAGVPRPAAKPPAKAAAGPGAPAVEADATEDAFIPINARCLPSAGFLSRRTRRAAKAALPAPAPVEPSTLELHDLAMLQLKVAEQDAYIRSQQERLAWMEERLQTMNMDLRALRELLHKQAAARHARVDDKFRLPLMRDGQRHG